jgi:hypothetical protein
MSEVTTRTFKPHKNLLYDVILRQAGTISKSILEAVMNSIDAGASRIDVNIDFNGWSIADNGKGFKDEKEIEDYFETFGTPHAVDENDNSTDAKYGRFRMGRGQIFAFGESEWTSNNMSMHVDIRAKGLDYDLKVHQESKFEGCKVAVSFYPEHRMNSGDLAACCKDVVKYCKYVNIDLFLNGERINVDPATCKWDHNSDDAYVNVKDANNTSASWSSHKGIDIYQQGVYVETIPHHIYGIGGTVVTKVPLKLNFARNQVIRSCPVWKRIVGMLQIEGQQKLSVKKELNESEREALVSQLLAGTYFKSKTVDTLKLFVDTNGRGISLRQLGLWSNGKDYTLTPAAKLPISFHKKGDRSADKVMQSKSAVVLDREYMLGLFQCADEQEFMDKLFGTGKSWRGYPMFHGYKCLEYVPFNEIGCHDTTHVLLDDKSLTPTQKSLLTILNNSQYKIKGEMLSLGYTLLGDRTIRMGVSETADGWTDGRTFIGINQNFSAAKGPYDLEKFMSLTLLLIHEFCHDESDFGSHNHDEDFYRKYHDVSLAAPRIASEMMNSYLNAIRHASKKVPATIAKQMSEAHELMLKQTMITEHDRLRTYEMS